MSTLGTVIKHLTALAFCLLLTAPVASQTGKTEVEITAVGDIMLDRGVATKIREFGLGYPFEKTGRVLSDADLAFANLENPVTDDCDEAHKKYVFKATPAYAEMLKIAGLDILSLANNHSLDCGQIGLDRTIEFLKGQKILSVGAGKDTDSKVVFRIKGVKIGFAAFTAISPLKPGDEYCRVAKAEPEAVSRTIEGLRNNADVIVVSFHWGSEYALKPNQQQIDLARLAVDAGADIVLGHHPHVLQGIELVTRKDGKRKAMIAYSLGNFVFDSPVRLIPQVGESMILRLQIEKDGLTGAEIVPVTIEGYRPVIASAKARKDIRERVERRSRVFGTNFLESRIDFSDKSAEKGVGR